jgi:hypothetical protein
MEFYELWFAVRYVHVVSVALLTTFTRPADRKP